MKAPRKIVLAIAICFVISIIISCSSNLYMQHHRQKYYTEVYEDTVTSTLHVKHFKNDKLHGEYIKISKHHFKIEHYKNGKLHGWVELIEKSNQRSVKQAYYRNGRLVKLNRYPVLF